MLSVFSPKRLADIRIGPNNGQMLHQNRLMMPSSSAAAATPQARAETVMPLVVRRDGAPDAPVATASGPAIGAACLPISNAQVTFTAAQTGTIEIVGARRPRRLSQFSENKGVTAHDLVVGFAADAWLLLPICAGVIVGGIGFPVLFELRRRRSLEALVTS